LGHKKNNFRKHTKEKPAS